MTPDMPVIKGPVTTNTLPCPQVRDGDGLLIAKCANKQQAMEIAAALNRQSEYDSERREMVRVMELAATELDKMKLTPAAQSAYLQLRAAIERGKNL